MADKTDKTDKSTWWSVTAFDPGELAELQGNVFPRFVKKLYGGLEECPSSGKIHFQGAIQCHTQQRFSALKKWLPKSHLEVARSADALIKYAMKEDTAVAPKLETTNTTPYAAMHEVLTQIAAKYIQVQSKLEERDKDVWDSMPDDKKMSAVYVKVTRLMLLEQPSMITAFMIPAMEKAWVRYSDVWIARSLVLQERANQEAELQDEISRQPETNFEVESTENGEDENSSLPYGTQA